MITTIKSWAESDRPREKLLEKGREVLSDAELLAILISSGTKSMSALELAKMILNDVQNDLNRLSRKSVHELLNYYGIGEAKATTVFAAMELASRRNRSTKRQEKKITSSAQCFAFFYPYFADLQHEEFFTLFLSRSNAVLGIQRISKGGVSGTVADGKVIFRRALEMNSSAIILAHNHPSGQLKPSSADIKLTNSFVEFGKMIDLAVLDHLIIADNRYFSFADQGILIE